jgi:purine-binding chemotaxis protein CheW
MSQKQAQDELDVIRQWVSFVLGKQTYAIDVLRVQEVLRPMEITPVAGSPYPVLGIINIRGNIISVIDARRCLGLSTVAVTDHSRIILVEYNDQVIGVMVDKIGEVLQLGQSQIESTPNLASGEQSGNIQGLTTRGSELVEIIDLDKLLTGTKF